MKLRRTISTIAISVLALGLLSQPAFAAHDAPPRGGDDPYREVAAQADERGYIIVYPEDAKAGEGDSVFFPTGKISDDTLVVIAEPGGKLPGGLTVEKLDQLVAERRAAEGKVGGGEGSSAKSNFTYSYAASNVAMSSPYNGGSLIGLNNSATASYIFNVWPGTSQVNAAQGRGYYRGYLGSVFGTWQNFYSLGTANSSSNGGASIPWGNVASVKQLKARCTVTTACSGKWQ